MTTQIAPRVPKLFDVEDGKIVWHPHKYQVQASASQASRIFILKGWRGGATSWASKWLLDEMIRCGPGNLNLSYFAIGPTHEVNKKGLYPNIQSLFCTHLGIADYNRNTHAFTINDAGERMLWGHAQKERTQILGCYAENPDSFASATFIGGVSDENGQKKFKRDAYNTLQARMATTSGQAAPNNAAFAHIGYPRDLRMGRIYAGSTVYELNWLEDLWNQWLGAMKAEKARLQEECKRVSPDEAKQVWADFNARAYRGTVHPTLHFIRYDSTENPAVSPAYIEEMRRSLPEWYFEMRFRAIFRRPAGIIFEDWDAERHVLTGNAGLWKLPRDIAIDFGRRNFRAQLWAHDEARGKHFLLASYRDRTLSNAERARVLLEVWGAPAMCVAGQISEEDDRAELASGGLPALPPAYKPLWTGINNMGAAIRENRVYCLDGKPYDGRPVFPEGKGFEHGSADFRDEMKTYARPVDENGKVKEDEDPEDKETYHCFVAGTLIETSDGAVPVEDVRRGMMALTRYGYQPVTRAQPSRRCSVLRVTFSDGRELVGSGEHPFYVQPGKWVRMDALRYGDCVTISSEVQSCQSVERRLYGTEQNSTATPTRHASPTGCISEPVESDTCTGRFGSFTTAPFPPKHTSTTLTATLPTTTSRTCNWWRARITNASSILGYALIVSAKIWMRYVRKPQSGIGARRVELGTQSTREKPWRNGNQKTLLANIAERVSRAKAYSLTSFAPTTASRRFAESPGLTTKREPALSANPSSCVTNTRAKSVAPVFVVRAEDAGEAQVYNLSVDRHPEYFANGVLVHNCVDASRYRLTRRYSSVFSQDMTPRAAGAPAPAKGDVPLAQVLDRAQEEGQSVVMAGGAGWGGAPSWGDALAQRYGLGTGGAYLDVDL